MEAYFLINCPNSEDEFNNRWGDQCLENFDMEIIWQVITLIDLHKDELNINSPYQFLLYRQDDYDEQNPQWYDPAGFLESVQGILTAHKSDGLKKTDYDKNLKQWIIPALQELEKGLINAVKEKKKFAICIDG